MKLLTTDELQSLPGRSEEFTLVNVLPYAEFAKTRIMKAVNIPLDEPDFEKRVERANGGKARTVVTYCASEDCPLSTRAAERLEKAGFKEVLDYKGGIKAWRAEKHPIAAPDEVSAETPAELTVPTLP